MPRMGRLALAALWAYAAEAQSPTQAPTFTTWRPTVAGASSPATTPAPSLRPTPARDPMGACADWARGIPEVCARPAQPAKVRKALLLQIERNALSIHSLSLHGAPCFRPGKRTRQQR